MGLITSVAEAGVMKQQGTAAANQTRNTGTSFSKVLKDNLSGISEDMDSIFDEAAAKYGLPASLIKSVAKAESNFNPNAVSRSGAVGVMQLMPGTAKLLGVTDSYDARQNIMGGAKYLKENLDRFGDVRLALAAYNAGPNSVKKYGGIPPYNETQNYVQKVMSYMEGSPIYANKSVFTGVGGELSAAYGSSLSNNSPFALNSSLSGLTGSYAMPQSALSQSVLSQGNGLSITQNGDSITMDKDSFVNLIQLLRLQMMMNADREVGTINI